MEAVVSGFQDVAAGGEAVEERRGHFRVAEHGGPFAEAEVGGYDDADALVELAQQMEEQRTARGAEQQVAQFVEDDEIEAGQAFCDPPGLALGFFLFQSVDHLDGGEEADLSAFVFNGLDAQGGHCMSFADLNSPHRRHSKLGYLSTMEFELRNMLA